MAYSPEQRKEIADKFCRAIASGNSVRQACELDGMPPYQTVYNWFVDDAEFFERYMRAREHRADIRFERIEELKEEAKQGTLDIQIARFLWDAERWQMGKENAKRYADRHVHQGADDAPPIKTQTSLDPTDKRDLARWIASRMTAGLPPADSSDGETD